MTLRVLIAVTHLLGAGHLTRAAAVARALARAGHQVTLASGGMPTALVGTDGFAFVQLPPVRTVGTDFRTLLDENGRPVAPSRLEARRDMLVETLDEAPPDVVVTELFPFGRRALAGEFLALIAHARAVRPDALVLASVRDILAAPAKPERVVETEQRLHAFYDAVLVHGDPKLVPIDVSWPVNGPMRRLLHYTGYVDDGAPIEHPALSKGSEIVVSGGSSAAGLPLYGAAIDAAALVTDWPWRILVGRGIGEADFVALRDAAPANVAVERARADFRALLRRAAVSVSQAGYNTVVDVLRTQVRAVFVPFEQGHETEQRLRAERLAACDLATIVAETDLTGSILAERVRLTLRRPPPSTAEIRLDGTTQSIAIIEELAAKRLGSPALRRQSASPSNWRLLENALNQAQEGGTVPFWWRDDDAVTHTRGLDRLLELARRFDLPLAIAAIPRRVEQSLVKRLRDEANVSVLVHGLAHANHAPEADKKAEFGSHRPLARLADDAAQALRLAHGHFGNLCLPVFVPPWNRVAPELVGALPELGFRGLSTYGRRRLREPASRLTQVNAHVDPIDWHHGRSLRPAQSILAELAQLIAAQAAERDHLCNEPIGFLTHHLVHDEALWSFCEDLLVCLTSSPNVSFPRLVEMFVGAPTSAGVER